MKGDDVAFMRVALEEAGKAVQEGNPPFGAVVTRDGQIVGRGHNRTQSEHDPTAHGEVAAIRAACRALGSTTLEGATVYTTCEPCLMCTGALIAAKVARVVIGARWADAPGAFHPERGSLLGMAPHVRYPFEHVAGVLREECARLYVEPA